jgi:hypothetical protein
MTHLLDTNICSAHMRRPGGLAYGVFPRKRFRSTEVFFIARVTWRLDRKKLAPKHSDGFLDSSGKGVRYDHRLRESFDNGAES